MTRGITLPVDQIGKVIKDARSIIREVEKRRNSMTSDELNREYCITQSNAIVNLNRAVGLVWNLPEDAYDALTSNEKLSRLKKDWGLNYSFEVAFELIKRSVQWFKDASV